MSRRPGADGARTAAAIRRAGLRLIAARGFAAMSLRELAAEAGIQPASLYHHLRNKQDLLFGLIEDHMLALLAATDAAVAAAGPAARARLEAFIAHHVLYHLERKQEVLIANFELRALEPRNYARIVSLRRAYDSRLIRLLDAGAASGIVRVADTRVAAYAILAMLTGACTWYRPQGRLSRAEVVRLHTGLALRACGAAACGADDDLRAEEKEPAGWG